MTHDFGSALFEQHQELLSASAISPEVARARGYVSVTEMSRLEAVGFSRSQRNVPGLLIPVHGVTGEVVGHEYRPDTPRVTEKGKVLKYEKPTGSANRLDVPAAVLPVLGDPNVPLWITEGARKVDAAVTVGLACVGLPGVWSWRGKNESGGIVALPDFHEVALNDRVVIICFDSDAMTNPKVRKAIEGLRGLLSSRGARTFVCVLPGDDGKVGLDDFLANSGTRDSLETLVRDELPEEDANAPTPPKELPASDKDIRIALTECLAIYRKWLHIESNDQIIAALAATAANVLPGDPFWILFVSAPGSGKTETIQPLVVLPYIHPAASFTEASLLSGVGKKGIAKGATGGLLRQIGDFGIFLCKDFSGVLSMNRDARAAALAALREVYDGSWDRPVGTDGGKVLSWQGKAGLIGAVTTSIDRHHAVMGTLGERFVLYRLSIDEPDKQGNRRIHNRRHEAVMRAELGEAVTGVVASLDHDYDRDLSDDEVERLVRLANYVTWARTAVERDGYSRDVEVMPEREMPGRLAGQLATYLIAIEAVTGGDTATAWRIVHKVAVDCLPALRCAVLDHLYASTEPQRRGDVQEVIDAPKTTVERTLEDLTLLKIVDRKKAGEADNAAWRYSLSGDARDLYPSSPEMSDILTAHAPDGPEPVTDVDSRGGSYSPTRTFDDISGELSKPPCSGCGTTDATHLVPAHWDPELRFCSDCCTKLDAAGEIPNASRDPVPDPVPDAEAALIGAFPGSTVVGDLLPVDGDALDAYSAWVGMTLLGMSRHRVKAEPKRPHLPCWAAPPRWRRPPPTPDLPDASYEERYKTAGGKTRTRTVAQVWRTCDVCGEGMLRPAKDSRKGACVMTPKCKGSYQP